MGGFHGGKKRKKLHNYIVTTKTKRKNFQKNTLVNIYTFQFGPTSILNKLLYQLRSLQIHDFILLSLIPFLVFFFLCRSQLVTFASMEVLIAFLSGLIWQQPHYFGLTLKICIYLLLLNNNSTGYRISTPLSLNIKRFQSTCLVGRLGRP